ncbi:MAG: ATP phosphoribosyltransferase regulatory subunit [Anaerolineaceae bacterium]|nr:ATP phosphoribosyltransferase regulatory subunit [Anaerolineaceae bacterium]
MTAQFLDRDRPVTLLRDHMAGYGYQLLETPVVGDASLFLTRAGDRMISRLFTFVRGGRELALRPEFTSQAARHYVHGNFSGVQRWQFAGQVFEESRQGTSRACQRFSYGAELFGLNGPAADAEIMALALTSLQELDVSNWRLVVGHVGLMRQMLAQFSLDERTERFLINNLRNLRQHGRDHVLQLFEVQLAGASEKSSFAPLPAAETVDETALAQLLRTSLHGTAMGGRDHRDIARRMLRKRQRMSERDQVVRALDLLHRLCQLSLPSDQAFTALNEITPEEARPILHSWQESLALLGSYGLSLEKIVIQPDLARDRDYYSGMVFEIHGADGQHLGGGGRYDELLVFMGAPDPVPAVGFACWLKGLEAARSAMPAVDSCSILLDGENSFAATRLARLLRSEGLPAELGNVLQADSLVTDADGRIRWRDRMFSLDEPTVLLEALRSA